MYVHAKTIMNCNGMNDGRVSLFAISPFPTVPPYATQCTINQSVEYSGDLDVGELKAPYCRYQFSLLQL